MSLTRRRLLQAAGATGLLSACSQWRLAPARPGEDFHLVAEPATLSIVPGHPSAGLAFNGGFPAPVLRVPQGRPVRIRFSNRMDQPTTIHWHGIRLANAMDGVPGLTQPPVLPGEEFIYEFTCPDAGTFWYHPHMHSVEQLGKGLTGTLIVEENNPPDFDGEVILQLRDWRLAGDGSWLPLSIPRQAFRMGTLGTVQTVNGELLPDIPVPANGRLRLRLLNLDNTRVYGLSLGDTPARVLAVDGSPVAQPYPLTVHDTGAGMRLDLELIAAGEIGSTITVYDQQGLIRRPLATLRIARSGITAPRPPGPALPANPLPPLDLDRALRDAFVFEWVGALSPAGAEGHNFWTINRRSWNDHSHSDLPAPLAVWQRGRTYVVELYNATPHPHPIHLHGEIFHVLSSSQRTITPWQTDTVLLQKNERVQIALVADNPGRWMFHCHVIEHMVTGLMGYVVIT
ncbi:MAG TPA: multicopper oxidase family protein [Spongiibacteraceae bacterium]|nr:multicopper oxidase family protein [Spongiibacteraceae bacterium]HUH38872.1 multicopper oxidase family protein [Spongiibacteraceae bacterium]